MASQLRLHVLLPIAVLGLLGLGVGAFAFGRGPGSGGDGALPPLPTHPTSTEANPGAELARWTQKTDAWCLRVQSRYDEVQIPKNPRNLDLALAKTIQIADAVAKEFPNLGWPKGKKRTVLRLRADLRTEAQAAHAAFVAFRKADQFGLERAVRRLTEADVDWRSKTRTLGARVCSADSADVGSARKIAKYGSAGAALTAALLHRSVVVVLFYAPGDDYDTIQTRETRAGALQVGAGFLALDVTKNDEVAALASQYEVRDSPATLVFIRGPKVFYRVSGYMDRQAVAQAASDALRR